MEVNLSPSLATDTPLDLKIKSAVFLDTMNLISIKKVDRRRDNLNHLKNRIKNVMRAKSYQQRQNYPGPAAPSKIGNGIDGNRRIPMQGNGSNIGRDLEEMVESRGRNVVDRISQLNSKLRDITRDFLIENQRKGNFIRIYPSKTCTVYDQYLLNTKPLNRLLYRCVFTDEIVPFPNGYPAAAN
jgi:hypothetical protein